MARSQGLIKKGDADALAELVRLVVLQDEPRMAKMRTLLEFQEDKDPITFPTSVTNPSKIHTGFVRSQHDLLYGILDKMPSLRIGTGSEVQENRDRAQARENFANAVFPAMQRRNGGPIWGRTLMDAILFGFGVDSQRGIPSRVSKKNGMPSYTDFPDTEKGAKEYRGARQDRLRQMAANGRERLPVEWSWTPATAFYFREGEESPNGLTLTVEVKTRNVKDLLESDRYARRLPKLRAKFEKLYDTKGMKGGAAMTSCRFIILEDKYLVSYLVLPEIPDGGIAGSDQHLSAQHQLWAGWDGGVNAGELADQFPNPVGYPEYVVTRGLFSNSGDPALQYRGFCYGILDLVGAMNHVLSWIVTRVKRESFPAWLITSQQQVIQGVPQSPAVGPGDAPAPIVQLHPGGDMATRMRPGEDIKPVLNTGGGPHEEWAYRESQRLAELQVVPSTLLDARGLESGYMMNSLQETILSRAEPLLEGVRTGHVQRWYLLVDQVRAMKEPLEVAGAIRTRGEDRYSAPFLSLDPEKLDDLEVVEAIYGLKKKVNTAVDIQNAAALLNIRMMTAEDIAADVLGVEDYSRVERWWMLQDWKMDPDVRKWMTGKLLELTGILIGDAVTKRAGAFSLKDLMAEDKDLAARIAQRTGIGMPGYGTAQNVLGQMGQANSTTVPPNGAGLAANGPPVPGSVQGVPSPIQPAARLIGGNGAQASAEAPMPGRRRGNRGGRSGRAPGSPSTPARQPQPKGMG